MDPPATGGTFPLHPLARAESGPGEWRFPCGVRTRGARERGVPASSFRVRPRTRGDRPGRRVRARPGEACAARPVTRPAQRPARPRAPPARPVRPCAACAGRPAPPEHRRRVGGGTRAGGTGRRYGRECHRRPGRPDLNPRSVPSRTSDSPLRRTAGVRRTELGAKTSDPEWILPFHRAGPRSYVYSDRHGGLTRAPLHQGATASGKPLFPYLRRAISPLGYATQGSSR